MYSIFVKYRNKRDALTNDKCEQKTAHSSFWEIFSSS